jgi:hypothetical protein
MKHQRLFIYLFRSINQKINILSLNSWQYLEHSIPASNSQKKLLFLAYTGTEINTRSGEKSVQHVYVFEE